MQGHSECRAFLLRLPLSLVVALLLWLMLRGALDVVIPRATQMLIRGFEYPRVTRLVPTDHLVRVQRADLRTTSTIPTISLTSIHFNTIVLLALHLALPQPWRRRQLECLFMGWCILLATQTLNLFFHVKYLYASGLGPWSFHHYSAMQRNLYGFGQYFTDLPGRFSFPFLIWLGFSWETVTRLVFARARLSVPRTGSTDKRSQRQQQ